MSDIGWHSHCGVDADVEFAAGLGGEVAVAGAIDEAIRSPRLAAGLRLGDTATRRLRLSVTAPTSCVCNGSSCRRRRTSPRGRPSSTPGRKSRPWSFSPPRCRARHRPENFLHDAGLAAAIDDLGEHARGPDAAEAAGGLEELHLGAGAGGGERGADAGGPGAHDEDVAATGDRDVAGGLAEAVRRRRVRRRCG
jgi:hypothetical protein